MRRASRTLPKRRIVNDDTAHSSTSTTTTSALTETFYIGDATAVQSIINDPYFNHDSKASNANIHNNSTSLSSSSGSSSSSNRHPHRHPSHTVKHQSSAALEDDEDRLDASTLQSVIQQFEQSTQHSPHSEFHVSQLLSVLPNRSRLKKSIDAASFRLSSTTSTSKSSSSSTRSTCTAPRRGSAWNSNARTSTPKSTSSSTSSSKNSKRQVVVIDDSDIEDEDVANYYTDELRDITASLHEFNEKHADSSTDDTDDEDSNTSRRLINQRRISRINVFKQHALSTAIPIGSYAMRIEGDVYNMSYDDALNTPLQVEFVYRYDTKNQLEAITCDYSMIVLEQPSSDSDSDNDVIETTDSSMNTSSSEDDAVDVKSNSSTSDTSSSSAKRGNPRRSAAPQEVVQHVALNQPFTPLSVVSTHRLDNTIDETILNDIATLYARGALSLVAQYIPTDQVFHVTIYLLESSMQPQLYDQPYQRKIKSVILNWCCGLYVTDALSNQVDDEKNDSDTDGTPISGENTHHINPHALYEAALPPSNWSRYSNVIIDQSYLSTHGLKATLLPYQLDAVQWMIKRETQKHHEEDTSVQLLNKVGFPTREPLYFWKTNIALSSLYDIRGNASKIYGATNTNIAVNSNNSNDDMVTVSSVRTLHYNRMTGQFALPSMDLSKEEVQDCNECSGGVLADEMGLGKTVEVLALLIAAPRACATLNDAVLQHIIEQIKHSRQLLRQRLEERSASKSKRQSKYSSSNFKQLIEAEDDDDSDEITCYCGDDDPNSSESFIQCEGCEQWQHQRCVRYMQSSSIKMESDSGSGNDNESKDDEHTDHYICPTCADASSHKLPSKATLIVCPEVILKQWKSEIELHTDTSKLNVLIYTGVRSTDPATIIDKSAVSNVFNADEVDSHALASFNKPHYFVSNVDHDFLTISMKKISPAARYRRSLTGNTNSPTKAKSAEKRQHTHTHGRNTKNDVDNIRPFSIVRPQQLLNYDIVLTTYNVLNNDLYHTNAFHRTSNLRHKKRFRILPCPLTGIEWHRIVMDEVQMCGDGSNKAAETVNQLHAIHRWAVSGTPLHRGLEDLYGALLFLRLEPYNSKLWWKKCMQHPYEHNNYYAVQRMHALISRIMWRNSKQSVASQLNLPTLHQHIYNIHFTPIERYYYNQRKEQCQNDTAVLRSKSDKSLTPNQLKAIFHSLLRLRQACIHPQIGKYVPVLRYCI
jgi:hypothetical protein